MTTTTVNDTYNGWTNRETWAAHLLITNDEYQARLYSVIPKTTW